MSTQRATPDIGGEPTSEGSMSVNKERRDFIRALVPVIVDHMTGNIAKVEPITEGEGLTQAKSQKAAMDKAKVKLADVLVRALG